MRKRTAFFTIFLCLQALIYAETEGTVGNMEPSDNTINLCNLPAPANISWSFPSPTTVLVSWTSVPGAWGYQTSLVSNAGTQGGPTQATSMLFNIVPNQIYTFTISSKCSPNSTSPLTKGVVISSYIVISDILTELAPSCSNLTQIDDADPVSNFTIDYASDSNLSYYLRFGVQPLVYDIHFVRQDLPNPPDPAVPYKFIAQPVEGQGTLLGCSSNPNGNPLNCERMYFSVGQEHAYVEMKRVVQASALDQIVITGCTFRTFGLYYCSGNFNGGGGDRNERVYSTQSYVVSPFHDYLQIGLDPSKRLKSIRMMDISGRLAFNQTMPDDIEFSEQLILPTEQLAQGLYILQLQSTDGKVEIFKVLKD